MEQTFGVFGISIKFQKLKSLWNQAEVRKENHNSKQNVYRTFTFEVHWLLCESSVLKLSRFYIFPT